MRPACGFPSGDSSQTGALYVPHGQGQWPGVLLINGAEVPGGWRSSEIETFAMSIADLGISVYVPDLPGFEGGSLTVVNVEMDRFSVALIPYTLANTTLGKLEVGNIVNLETDLLAKYVERQLATATSDA